MLSQNLAVQRHVTERVQRLRARGECCVPSQSLPSFSWRHRAQWTIGGSGWWEGTRSSEGNHGESSSPDCRRQLIAVLSRLRAIARLSREIRLVGSCGSASPAEDSASPTAPRTLRSGLRGFGWPLRGGVSVELRWRDEALRLRARPLPRKRPGPLQPTHR
jgi:hypothetical protein